MGESFFSVFLQMGVLFLIVGVGYAAKKVSLMDSAFDKALSKVVLNAVLPAMILSSVLAAETLPTLEQLASVALASLCVYALMLAAALIFTFVMRISPGHQGVFRFMMLFGNVGFIGFPVTHAIFGSGALIYASIFQIPFNFLVFSLGIYFLVQDNEAGVKVRLTLKAFLSPALISCICSICLILLGVHNVPVLGQFTDTLGSMTTPASLLVIGSSLANMPVSSLVGGARLWVASAVRLLVTPLVAMVVLRLFVGDATVVGVLVVLCGMPVATNGTMLCYQYGGDAKTMAQGTFITTVFSLLSIPLLVALLG